MNDDPFQPGDRPTGLAAPRSPSLSVGPYVVGHLLVVPLVLAALAWWVEYGPLDMFFSRLFVDPVTHAFTWRSSAVLDILGHQAARGLPVIVAGIAIAAGCAGFAVAQLRPWTPILLTIGAAMLLGPLAVNALKGTTTQHCPSALQSFGGVVDYGADRAGAFWAASRRSAGHCLPSGHAAGGYALLSLYFAGWAAGQPAWRWRGLAVGIAAGMAFSIVRLLQGAHFVSATLWSATVDWTICAALFLPLLCHRPTRGR